MSESLLATSAFRKLRTKAGPVAATVTLFGFIVALLSPAYAAAATFKQLEDVVSKIISLLAPAAAIAFLFMVVVGAFKFITSGGDPKGAAGARSTLTYAILGVILVIASWLVLKLIQEITKAPVTQFTIPTP